MLMSGRHPSCTRIAERLEVSLKTIRRDIEFMRDRLNLPIEFSRQQNGYVYTAEVTSLPTVAMSSREWQALIVARKALDQYRGCPWSPQMNETLDKISSGFDELISSSNLDALISFRNTGIASVDPDVFEVVSRALIQSRELVFRFQKFSTARPDTRRVQPYHLSCVNGDWHLIGFNVERGAMRVYALNRMFAVKMDKASFKRSEAFSIAKFLGTSFGVSLGSSTAPVRLHFVAEAAWKVRQRVWHASQQLEEQPDGSLHLSLSVQPTSELLSWILSWGNRVKVLAPKNLAVQVAEIMTSAASSYSAD
jgi:proteasome accessory factor B